ncbi:MAG: class I SAM-dependent methyltransferase [Candidatus Limnocylindrales bacterium]|nr:class I SAM-dependent methyltransferase [Candidatus Limnocylindrales bacterium]
MADLAATYVRLREREGRLYPDAVVARLPESPAGDPLRAEWRQRADAAGRLVAYLVRLRCPLVVLELGCGNGWLANQIALIPDSAVVGVEVNELELHQARRVFARRRNLRFVLDDMRTMAMPADRPDIIVLASVIQYVPDLPALLGRLLSWLGPGGEVHILDSGLYRSDQVADARDRTRRYYAAVGFPEMAEVYQHHDERELDGFATELLYRPDEFRRRLERRLGRARSPFPWIRVRPESAP